MARKRKTSAGPSDRQLDEMIEEATVDAYDEEEPATGFYTMIDDNLALPFRTRILGIEVLVIAVGQHIASKLAEIRGRRKPRRLIARPSAHTFAACILARLLGYPCFPGSECPFAAPCNGSSLLVSSRCFRMV